MARLKICKEGRALILNHPRYILTPQLLELLNIRITGQVVDIIATSVNHLWG